MGGQLSKNAFFDLARIAQDYPKKNLFRKWTVVSDDQIDVENDSAARVFATFPFSTHRLLVTMWLWPDDDAIDLKTFERNCSEIVRLKQMVDAMRTINDKILRPGVSPNFLPFLAYGEATDLTRFKEYAALEKAIDVMEKDLVRKSCVPLPKRGWFGARADPAKLRLCTAVVGLRRKGRCLTLLKVREAIANPKSTKCVATRTQYEAMVLATVYSIGVANDAGVFHNALTDRCAALHAPDPDDPRPIVAYVVGNRMRVPEDMRVFTSETLPYQPAISDWRRGTVTQPVPPPQADLFTFVCSVLIEGPLNSFAMNMMSPYVGSEGMTTLGTVQRPRSDEDLVSVCAYKRASKWLTAKEAPFPTPAEFLTNHAPPHFAPDSVMAQPRARRQFEEHGAVVYVKGGTANQDVIDRAKRYLHEAYCRNAPAQPQPLASPAQPQPVTPPHLWAERMAAGAPQPLPQPLPQPQPQPVTPPAERMAAGASQPLALPAQSTPPHLWAERMAAGAPQPLPQPQWAERMAAGAPQPLPQPHLWAERMAAGAPLAQPATAPLAEDPQARRPRRRQAPAEPAPPAKPFRAALGPDSLEESERERALNERERKLERREREVERERKLERREREVEREREREVERERERRKQDPRERYRPGGARVALPREQYAWRLRK